MWIKRGPWTPIARTSAAKRKADALAKSPGGGAGASPLLGGPPWPEVGIEDGGDSGFDKILVGAAF